MYFARICNQASFSFKAETAVKQRRGFFQALLLLWVVMVGAGCAIAITDPVARMEYERINDPLEPVNRTVFSFNSTFQTIIVRPLASMYNFLPSGVHTALENFFSNLSEPRNVVNALLQGDPKASGTTLGRFLTNSTVGLGGLIDITGEENHDPRDFGQTLAQWTGGTGPYLELPFIGSSSTTATAGLIFDGLYSVPQIQANRTEETRLPIAMAATQAIQIYGENIDNIDNIFQTSLDPYVAFRNAYQQRRNAFIFGDDSYSIDDLDFDL